MFQGIGCVSEEFEHRPANAVGLLDTRFEGAPLVSFRGIKYASIPGRFAAPVLQPRDKSTRLRATAFGPRCPQLPVDVRDLMQVPKDLELYPPETEDEFECLNLNVTIPAESSGKLPVLIWIYGGSQVVSFSSAAQRLCETGPFAAQAITSGQPVVLVNPHYRLSILAYGDGEPTTEKNLHVQDLQCAVRWTIDNIADFGGDPTRITVAGESAGAILTHALCATLPTSIPIQQAILCSGSLGASKWQPPSFYQRTLDRVLHTARTLATAQSVPNANSLTLKTVPLPLLIASMAANTVTSIPLQQPTNHTDPLSASDALKHLSSVMIGDCEFESVLWLPGIRLMSDETIQSAFLGTEPNDDNSAPNRTKPKSSAHQRLITLYLDTAAQPDPTSPTLTLSPTKTAALNFMADYLFHTHTHHLSLTNTTQTKIYIYLFDEPNPFASTTNPNPATAGPRAHHGVDLLALWNTYSTAYPPPNNGSFENIAHAYREKIIAFVNGKAPWPAVLPSAEPDQTQDTTSAFAYAFGPGGEQGPITATEYAQRRRVSAIRVMKEEVGDEIIDEVWTRLVGGVQKEVARAMARAAAAAAAGDAVGNGTAGTGEEGKEMRKDAGGAGGDEEAKL